MSWLGRYILTGIAAAALAMLFEPFFSSLLGMAGINSATWAEPFISFVRSLSQQAWFQGATLLLVGFAAGTWTDFALRKSNARTQVEYQELGGRLTALMTNLEILEQNIDENELPHTNAFERYVNQLRSLEVGLEKIGVPAPKVDYDIDPIGYIMRMRTYTSRIAPLISDGHIAEAKRQARKLSQEIRDETEAARQQISAQPKFRYG